jgi:hypothetical protein
MIYRIRKSSSFYGFFFFFKKEKTVKRRRFTEVSIPTKILFLGALRFGFKLPTTIKVVNSVTKMKKNEIIV